MNITLGLPPILPKNTPVAMDVELFHAEEKRLHRPTGEFACLSVCFDSQTVHLIEDVKDVRRALQNVKKGQWIFHNAMFDIRQLRRWADVPDGNWWDTMIVERELYGGYYDTFALDDLCRRWLGEYLPKEERKSFLTATEMNPTKRKYAARDALVTYQCQGKQAPEYSDFYSEHKIWEEVDLPALQVFLEFKGMMLDVPEWKKLIKYHLQEKDKIRKELDFNPGSWQQVQKVLQKQGIHTKTTGVDDLEEHSDNPIVQQILAYRTFAKAASTYGENFLKMIEEDGRIYSSYNICGAETGRTSSDHPNFQNIPVRSGPHFRKCFIAPRGRRYVIADSSQQEPRINAYMAQDHKAIELFKLGDDVYIAYGQEILGTKITKSDPRRKVMKPLVLGLAYGLSEYGLSKQCKKNGLDISVEEARKLIRRLRSVFPAQARYIDRMRSTSAAYVTTPVGRRFWLNRYSQQWVNNVLNAPVQGGACDGSKIAMPIIRDEIRQKGLDAFFVNFVHDEFIVECATKDAMEVAKIVRRGMIESSEAICPGVPFEADVYIGTNWADKDNHDCKIKFKKE